MADFNISFGVAEVVQAFVGLFDMKPCNTRFKRIKATPDAWFKRRKVAVHRMENGKFEINPLDPSEGAEPAGQLDRIEGQP